MQESDDKKKAYFDKMVEHYTAIELNLDSEDKIDEMIEHFINIIQIFIWGEKNEQVFFDFFIEQHILSLFVSLAEINKKYSNEKENAIKIIKFYSFFILNLKNTDIINYVYSHSNFNNFLTLEFDFDDDEVVFYYVNFVKSLSQQFDNFPFQIFYNSVS